MAIVIPSKNIYQKENKKSLDNYIDNIELNYNQVLPSNEYDVSVFNGAFETFEYGTKQETGIKSASLHLETTISGSLWDFAGAYTYVVPRYAVMNIEIPVVANNKYINYIYSGKDSEGNRLIKHTIFGKIIKYKCSAKAKSTTGNTEDLVFIENPAKGEVIEEKEVSSYVLPSLKIENKEIIMVGVSTADASMEVTDNTMLIRNDGSDFYGFYYYLLSGIEICKITGRKFHTIKIDDENNSFEMDFEGTIEQYIPTRVEIIINGNTIGIELQEKTEIIGESKEKPFSVSNNELLQDNLYSIEEKYLSSSYYNYTTVNLGQNIYAFRFYLNSALDYDIEVEYTVFEQTSIGVSSQAKTRTLFSGETEFTEKYQTSENSSINVADVFVKFNTQQKILKENYEKVLNNYKKGKEILILRCGINKYYNSVVFKPSQYIGISNANYDGGLVTQIQKGADSKAEFFLQAYNNNGEYITYNSITLEKPQRIVWAFDKKSGFDYLRFHENDSSIDTNIHYNISNLTNGKTYYFSVDVISVEQGKIAWENMQIYTNDVQTIAINPNSTGKQYFEKYDKVMPMVMDSYGKDLPISLTSDGDPKIFQVVGTRFINDGAIFQELSLQEI